MDTRNSPVSSLPSSSSTVSTPSARSQAQTQAQAHSITRPQFPPSAQSRFSYASHASYATASPPTPNADLLFYRPPSNSTSPASVLSASINANAQASGRPRSRLVEGVAVGYGMDARQLADMLSPPENFSSTSLASASSSKSHSSAKKKGKKIKTKVSDNSFKSKSKLDSKSRENVYLAEPSSNPNDETPSPPRTPPPVPPKTLLPTTTPKSTRTTTSFASSLSLDTGSNSHSNAHSHSTEIHSPRRAEIGRMASASSHQLQPKPSLDSLSAFSTSNPSFRPSPGMQGYPHRHNDEADADMNQFEYREGTDGQPRYSESGRPSINLNFPNPSESFDHDDSPNLGLALTSGTSSGRERLHASLAALPWAEPPPRQPSPLASSPTSPQAPSTATATGTGYGYSDSSTIREDPNSASASARTPTYSFLASDPVSTPIVVHSRRASATSSIRSQYTMPRIAEGESSLTHETLDVPRSPSNGSHDYDRNSAAAGRRYSEQSAYSGKADLPTSISNVDSNGNSVISSASSPISMTISQDTSSPGIDSLVSGQSQIAHTPGSGRGGGGHSRWESIASAMATKASSSAHSHSKGKWSFGGTTSKSTSYGVSHRTKSTKSTKSSRSMKRGSNSTLNGTGQGQGQAHRLLKKWEIHALQHRWEELEDGETDEIRRKEGQMDLRSLVGRAWMLERVLRSGKRVSSQSLRILRPFTPSSNHSPPRPPVPHLPSSSISSITTRSKAPRHRPSLSVSVVHSRRSSLRPAHTRARSISDDTPEIDPDGRTRKTKTGNRVSSSNSNSNSTSPRKSTSTNNSRRKSLPAPSLRERLGRKLRRTESREDIFTELDSDSDFDRSAEGIDIDVGVVNYPSVPSPKRTRETEKERQTGEDRMGGKGVIVFPEEEDRSPPLPPKPRQWTQADPRGYGGYSGYGGYGGLKNCTTPGNCINLSPTSPTPLLPPTATSTENLKPPAGAGEREREGEQEKWEYTSDGGQVIYRHGDGHNPQSPHLGHRSPDWRNRQSVISYLETGVWEEKPKNRFRLWVALAAGLVVLLIVGLLVGLLVKRNASE
ncbi:uncharacterized protein I303_102358 [Kwoniella dejecticola CBS 10117]|uniref:Uncharacterized protein n=1 Tax=Kwoniella dejecticola CBS 10117 TaxID=1296121 RepID=A0AAJ8MEZ6_9TREE